MYLLVSYYYSLHHYNAIILLHVFNSIIVLLSLLCLYVINGGHSNSYMYCTKS